MNTSTSSILAALFALSQSSACVEAFATDYKSIARIRSSPLGFKNEFMSEIENEVLVSKKKGKKKGGKGFPRCQLTTTPRNAEPIVLKASARATKEGTFWTHYDDVGASEGLPLFRAAELSMLDE